MAEIVLDRVSKAYAGGTAAVRDLSLTVADGELLVLVGPSGCGKTTTLRLIAGLEEADAGEIRIGGRTVNGVHPGDRDIAMVFQNYALYPHMTVYRNMAFALRMRRVARDRIDRRVRETARLLGIEALLDRRPAALSGGQRQRVALGRAIVREPKAFLFDEPLSNLDARLRTSTRAELKALHQRLRTTTVHVTHDQEEAMTLGDRIAVMAGGVLQQVGPPLEVYCHPVNRFVAGFIGTPPMNFFSGAVVRDGGTARFHERAADGDGFRLPLATALADGRPTDRPLVCGIRPQALSLVPTSPAPPGTDEGTIEARVEVVEPLGDQQDLVCTTPAGSRFVARVPGAAGPTPGRTVRLAVSLDRVHLFEEGDFGAAVNRPGRA
jgi:multiple sugar transport system ATP-binding protein